MTNEEIQSIFFLECEEALEAAENGLDACRSGTHDSDTVNGIFRAVHSIKGGAGAFGFTALQGFTHGFETLLSDVRDGLLGLGDDLVALMLRALDTLSDHVTAARSGGEAPEDADLIAEMAAAQANGNAPQAEGEAEDAVAEVEEPAAPAPVDGLDFDLDAMLNDIALPAEDEAVAEDAEPETPSGWRVRLRPHDAAMANGGEPLLLLRELARLGGTCMKADCDAIPGLDEFDANMSYLGWEFFLPASVERSAIDEIFDFVADDYDTEICASDDTGEEAAPAQAEPQAEAKAEAEAPARVSAKPKVAAVAAPVAVPDEAKAAAPAKAPAAPAAASQSIRIDLAKLDRLIDSVGELVIAQAMMAQRLSGHGLAAIEELAMLDGLTRDIQESAMSIRAQPIGSVFSRVPRMLRELESSTGKRVRLEMSGEATELDKTVIERLGEPLTHLIRNAVDHGIETPEERQAAGKAVEGVLQLSAEHKSGRIVIKVADDGKGIDHQRVFAKAVERGLVQPDASLSDEEIDNLIFAPGFSTAESVSNISGRGVGMDVVRQNVKDLGGRISIESRPGEGSVFTLAMPLTLAISDGMIVTVGDQTLVLPLAHVVESLRPQESEVAALGSSRQMLNVRGRFIPILPLEDSVGARNAAVSPLESVLIVVDTESAGQAALQVDAICDQRQFVIKSLDTHYRPVECVAGATILGDGRVALILDVDALVAEAVAHHGPVQEAA
ncbi:MAG: chemotaxis protein CheA [Blastomonas sp.]